MPKVAKMATSMFTATEAWFWKELYCCAKFSWGALWWSGDAVDWGRTVSEAQESLDAADAATCLLLQSEDHLVVDACFFFGTQKRASLLHLRIGLRKV
jgi:hypothetical protein